MQNKILFFDYSAVNKLVIDEIKNCLNLTLNFTSTDEYKDLIRSFEKKFAKYNETSDCIAVNSGTTALQIALLASGVKKDDEVIIPAYTFAATAIAVSNIGAKPVFVDIKISDLTIDEEKIEEKITPRTRAIIPVHIHGNPCNMDKIINICEKNKLVLIEDASQAHGAKFKGKKVGSFGTGCFSLHMSKNLGSLSRAGAITFNNKELRTKIIKYLSPDNNSFEVINSGRTSADMDVIHACFLIPKLDILDKLNSRKNEMACLYNKLLDDFLFDKPKIDSVNESVYRDYFILCKERNKIKQYMHKNGVETKVRYHIPLHLTKTFEYLGYVEGDFPISERVAKEVLCLPTHLGITNENINYICLKLNEVKK